MKNNEKYQIFNWNSKRKQVFQWKNDEIHNFQCKIDKQVRFSHGGSLKIQDFQFAIQRNTQSMKNNENTQCSMKNQQHVRFSHEKPLNIQDVQSKFKEQSRCSSSLQWKSKFGKKQNMKIHYLNQKNNKM